MNCKYCNNEVKNYKMHKPQCVEYKKYFNNTLVVLTENYLIQKILHDNIDILEISENLDINKSHITKLCNKFKIPYTETKKKLYRIDNLLTKTFLINEYINNDKSIKQISEENNITQITIKKRLNKYNIKEKTNTKNDKIKNENIENNLTYELLYKLYITEGRSLKNIANIVGLKKTRRIKKKLQEYNIEIRNLQEAKKQKHHVELAKQTSLERYGVEFHLQKGSDLLDKSKKTIKKKYGKDIFNIGQVPEIKNKIRKTTRERYGVDNVFEKKSPIRIQMEKDYFDKTGYTNPFANPEVINKCMETKLTREYNTAYYSKKSQLIFWNIYNKLPKELQKHTYFAELNKEFGKFDTINNKYYFYDFVISNINFCLEYNGNYYHANPDMYTEDFINKHMGLTAKEIWKKDEIKNQFISGLGFNVHIIWESDDEESKIEDILNHINMSS